MLSIEEIRLWIKSQEDQIKFIMKEIELVGNVSQRAVELHEKVVYLKGRIDAFKTVINE